MRRIMVLNTVILLSLASILSAKDIETDWAVMRLRGKVEFLREVVYRAVTKNGAIEKGERLGADACGGDYFLAFDKRGRRTARIVFNSEGEAVSQYSYKYDSKGRLLGEKWSGEKPGECLCDYNDKGDLISKRCSGAEISTVTYVYDASGHLNRVTDFALDGSVLGISIYDTSGNMVEYVYKSNGRAVFAHNDKGDEIEATLHSPHGEGHDMRYFKYEYDKGGNWVSKIEYDYASPVCIIERVLKYY